MTHVRAWHQLRHWCLHLIALFPLWGSLYVHHLHHGASMSWSVLSVTEPDSVVYWYCDPPSPGAGLVPWCRQLASAAKQQSASIGPGHGGDGGSLPHLHQRGRAKNWKKQKRRKKKKSRRDPACARAEWLFHGHLWQSQRHEASVDAPDFFLHGAMCAERHKSPSLS